VAGVNEPTYPVQSTQTSFRILETVNELDEPRLADLDDELDVAKSVIHNHLQTLLAEGYVVRTENTYDVGTRFLSFGASARRSHDVFEEAKPKVDAIARETGDQVNMVFEENGEGVVVYQRNGEEAVNSGLAIGTVTHLHCTAAGKAILAFLPDERVDEILSFHGTPEYTCHTTTDEADLRAELADVQPDLPWVTYDYSERARGVKSIGTPLIDSSLSVHGAISVTLPNSRFDDESHREAVIEHLETERPIISTNISYD
jgi:DNA-binding IclR family transcriptional regulator